MKKLSVLLVMLIMLSAAAHAAVPEYTVMRTTGKIVLDGVLDEDDWSKAESVGAFTFPWWSSGEQEQTEVKLLWDDRYLYLAFACSDKNIWADHYNINDATYNDDCVELFWNPSPGEQESYYMFEINCISNLLSVNKADRATIMVPHIAQRIDGTLNADNDTDSGWVIEMAVRFDEYTELYSGATPIEGDMWRIGLNRCGGKINYQYSQWSPSQTTNPNFHQPDDFGKIYFSNDPSGTPTTVKSEKAVAPESIKISNTPNPFNAQTVISYELADAGDVELTVYDSAGRIVRDLTHGHHSAGTYTAVWDGFANDGTEAASGIYFSRIKAGTLTKTGRMTLVK